ncbi:Sgf11 (transcriptional regulation protein) [Musa troglodytarum]|uniref:Sgf11 (Transcriptional regulation protein) n=2 Tax=Musa troglodytarum TaxID=320322 RepID=A0A9E7FXM6_9LILI|nr:Sgf11 (transcriptional regulation protein) [Musa troglodytarum]
MDDLEEHYINIDLRDDDLAANDHQAEPENITLFDTFGSGVAETDLYNHFERFDIGDDETHINFTPQEEPEFEAPLRPSLPHEDEIRSFTHLRNLLESFFAAGNHQTEEKEEQKANVEDVQRQQPVKRKAHRKPSHRIMDDKQLMIPGNIYQLWLQDTSDIVSKRGRTVMQCLRAGNPIRSTKISHLMDLPPVALVSGLEMFPAKVHYPAPLMELWRKCTEVNISPSGDKSPPAQQREVTETVKPLEEVQGEIGSNTLDDSIEKLRANLENLDFQGFDDGFGIDHFVTPGSSGQSSKSMPSSGSGHAFMPLEPEIQLPSVRSKRKQHSSSKSFRNLDPVEEELPLRQDARGSKIRRLSETGPTPDFGPSHHPHPVPQLNFPSPPSLLLSEIKTTGPIPLPFIPKDRVLIAAIDQPQAQRSDCALAPSLRAPSLRSLHLPALCLCFFRPLGFSSLAGVFLPPEIALFGLMTPKASDSVTGARGIPLLSWLLLASLLPWRLQLGASIDDEARALLSFKANTEFDPYGALADWEEADEVDSCFWFGVRCDAGRVVALNLKDLCLKGKLAPELGQLIHLKSLILSNNSFYGVIPEELSALQNLEVLDLGHNNLTGPLPTFLSHLLSLRILILTDNGFVGSMSSVLHELNILSEVQFDEDMLSSNKGLITRNLKNATIRRLLQLANHSPAAAAAAAPAPAPASLHNSRHRKRNKNNTNIRTPSAGPSSSSVPPENSHTPFLHPTHAPVVSPSPSASAPSIALPSSPSSHHVPAPAPVIEPPTSVPHNQTKFDLAPSPVSILIPPPIGSPAAAANTHKKHARLWVLSSIASAVSFLLAISAVYLLCWRANKVVTIRPWATGLSGQLQKAFVTGVPALKRSELVAACEDFSNIIGSLSGCMLYKGTLSSGVEIAVISTVVKSAKDWSKQSVTQFRKKVTMLSKLNHKNFVNLLGYCEESEPFSRMMVFEYAPNGTLFEHLHVKEAEHLDWRTRLRIAMGIAYCLEHMHQLNPPIILGSLDSSTVYLTDDYAAKVSDVQFWTGSKDTGSGSGSSSPLSDAESIVHRFGMLLLEILSGRLPFSEEDGLLEQWALCYLNGEKPFKDSIDPTLKSFDEETCDALCKVICCCIQPEAKERPTMAEVTKRMRDITAMPPDGATPKVSPLWWAELEIISSDGN